ncbi:hypothetical protein MTP99_007703 [Tenebrio molitor]|nr:hypothetical protein MTP99_007703 [Tenebrio molitor]
MIRAVLIDLSGTLHIENQAIPGAVEALKKLLQTSLTIKFVTNTTKESQNFLYNRLTALGFPVQKEQIFSSLAAARALIVNKKLKPMLLLSPEALEDFEGLACPKNENPNAVVIGLAPNEFHYERLNDAFKCLLNGAELIGIHAGKTRIFSTIPEEAIMIGDDVTDDVEGAMKAGIKGYLVQTGKYQPGDEHKICTTPDAVVPSFVEAVEKILLEIKQ